MKDQLALATIALARRALALMSPERREEATRIINHFERTANAGDDDELQSFYRRAAGDWEHDMAPVRDAIVEALQASDTASLAMLRHRMPQILAVVNKNPSLAGLMMRQLLRVFAAHLGDDSTHTANATASLQQWRGRQIFPTDMGSADLRGLSSELHLRSIFSARTTNADYLNEVGQIVDRILSGEINMATGRWLLMKKLKQLGYDPETGFPQDMALIPPAEKGSLQDLSSEQRIDLMLKTNVALTRNYARVVEGNTEFARYAFPAWELVRLEWREVPRGERRGKEGALVPDPRNAWPERWRLAAESVDHQGVLLSSVGMIALKDSPVWQALANGAGGYNDTLGHPFPPFAFNSGMDWKAVSRKTCIVFGLLDEGRTVQPMEATLAPTVDEVNAAYDRLSPELKEKLHNWMAE
jgi:hypothetical protein